MLGMSSYDQDYIDACRKRVDSDMSAYRHLVDALRKQPASGQLSFQAFYAYANSPSETKTIELSCPKFRRR